MNKLLEKAKAGDIDAYTKLILSYEKSIKEFARNRLNNKDDIDDIFQEVYYKAYIKLGTLKDDKSFKSWIFAITRNECLNLNRKSANEFNEDITEYGDILEDKNGIRLDERISFESLIKDLNEDEKRFLRLKFEENFTNKEISEDLGIPYNTVKSKILRALKKITLVLLILITISGFTVLATFIIKQIKAHFTTSLNAINTAVENNYVQEIDSDFVYDNGIGIKIDAIVLDDKNLDISFVYDIQDKEKYGDITGIRLEDYVVKADDEILFDSKVEEGRVAKRIHQYSEKYEKDDDYKRNSILFSANKKFPTSKVLIFHVSKIIVLENEEKIDIEGNWNIKYSIDNKLNERNKETYIMEENEYVESYEVSLIDTALSFYIELNTKLYSENIEKVLLYDLNNNCFKSIKGSYYNDKLEITYDLSKYFNNTNELLLEIPKDDGEKIILKFRRSQ